MTINPASASAGTWWRHSRPESGNPWSNITGWPVAGHLVLDAHTANVDAHCDPPVDGGKEYLAG
jgi:hypothetical protein